MTLPNWYELCEDVHYRLGDGTPTVLPRGVYRGNPTQLSTETATQDPVFMVTLQITSDHNHTVTVPQHLVHEVD
jgi:hypothetical protein